jgi:4-amino-4-deoxy-L-arabinose transferase-like glycosyltransferase
VKTHAATATDLVGRLDAPRLEHARRSHHSSFGRIGQFLRRGEVAIALVVLALLAPLVQPLTAQPASRYDLTAALVDHHTVSLDRYAGVLGTDRAEHHGDLRSDKAPGQPILSIPVYAVFRALGGEAATHRRLDRNLGLWWVTLWSAVIPMALLAALTYRVARAIDRRAAIWAALSMALATPMLAYGSQLFGHVLAAAAGYAAWVAARPREASARRLLIAGLFAGLATITEYPAAIVLVVVGVVVLLRHRRSPRRLAAYGIGAAAMGLVGALYQHAAFGSVFSVSYEHRTGHDHGLFGIDPPQIGRFVSFLGGPRGLLATAPIVFIALAGIVFLLRRKDVWRVDAAVALAVFAGFVLVEIGMDDLWHGEAFGPRYLIPALPFLVVPLTAIWRRVQPLAVIAAVYGALTCLLPTITTLLTPPGSFATFQHLDFLRAGGTVPTLWTMALGKTAGWAVYAVIVAVALLHLSNVASLPNESVER